VNLLASNSGANFYNSGSGIYSDGEILQTFYNPTWNPDSVLMIATVPDISDRESATFPDIRSVDKLFSVLAEFTPAVETMKPVPGQSGTLQTNYEDISCEVHYTVSASSEETDEIYGVVAYSGPSGLLPEFQLCGFVKCANGSASSCSQFELSSNTTFSFFAIHGSGMKSSYHRLSMASSDNAQLIEPSNYVISEKGDMKTTSEFESTILSISIVALGPWKG